MLPVITKTQTITYQVLAVSTRYVIFNESYRKIRSDFKYQGFECFACGRKFNDGEEIGIIFTSRGNKVVCQECGAKLKNELEASNEHSSK